MILNYNLMIDYEKLGEIHIILAEIEVEMIPLIDGTNVFHSVISKTIVDIQEANSPYSFKKISPSTTPWTWK